MNIIATPRERFVVPGNQTEEFDRLLEQSRRLAKSEKSDATQKAYISDFTIFSNWCQERLVTAIPATVETIAAYVADCREREIAASTLTRYLTSISQAHQLAGFDSPTNNGQVRAVVKGFKRECGTAQRKAKPLSFEQLIRVVNALGSSIKGMRDAALLTVGWMAALRRSEIVALNRDDIESVDQGLVVHVRSSKTDQESEGYSIGIPFGSDKFCPVNVIRRWYTVAQIESGPLFFGVYRGASAKMFATKLKPRKALNDRAVVDIIRSSLEQAGYDSRGYSGHSLRAGFVTAIAALGVPSYAIRRHTRHRSQKVLEGYIRDGTLFTTNPLSLLLAPNPALQQEPAIVPNREPSFEVSGDPLSLPAHGEAEETAPEPVHE